MGNPQGIVTQSFASKKILCFCSGNGAEITIGTEMIGQSIQCQANNGLFSDSEMPTSQAIQIDPYSKKLLLPSTNLFQPLLLSFETTLLSFKALLPFNPVAELK